MNSELQKTEIVVYESIIEKARNFLKQLENKQDTDSYTRAKRDFYIQESLRLIKQQLKNRY